MNSAMQNELLARFVESFHQLDELRACNADLIAWQLASGPEDIYGYKAWRPARLKTDPAQLESLYAKLPARFPPLYERLLLTYRWDMVDLELLRLLPNPPGDNFSGLLPNEKNFLSNFLIRAGCIRFGFGGRHRFRSDLFRIEIAKEE